jgi:general stress protein YciG
MERRRILMAGTLAGGKLAAQKNLASDPDFYRKIGAIGGRNGTSGGFAVAIPCDCDRIEGPHLKRQCAGKVGGTVSRKNVRDKKLAMPVAAPIRHPSILENLRARLPHKKGE